MYVNVSCCQLIQPNDFELQLLYWHFDSLILCRQDITAIISECHKSRRSTQEAGFACRTCLCPLALRTFLMQLRGYRTADVLTFQLSHARSLELLLPSDMSFRTMPHAWFETGMQMESVAHDSKAHIYVFLHCNIQQRESLLVSAESVNFQNRKKVLKTVHFLK